MDLVLVDIDHLGAVEETAGGTGGKGDSRDDAGEPLFHLSTHIPLSSPAS